MSMIDYLCKYLFYSFVRSRSVGFALGDFGDFKSNGSPMSFNHVIRMCSHTSSIVGLLGWFIVYSISLSSEILHLSTLNADDRTLYMELTLDLLEPLLKLLFYVLSNGEYGDSSVLLSGEPMLKSPCLGFLLDVGGS